MVIVGAERNAATTPVNRAAGKHSATGLGTANQPRKPYIPPGPDRTTNSKGATSE